MKDSVRGDVPIAARERRRIAVLAVRPEVLPLVVAYNPGLPWGVYLELEGTEQQLIDGAVASPEMMADFGASAVKSGPDEFGCKYTVERLASGRYRLMHFLTESPCYGDVVDLPREWSPLARELLPGVCAFVEAALRRLGRVSVDVVCT